MRLWLAGVLTAAGLVALTPATAHACFCAAGPDRQEARRADAVFTGTFTRFVAAPERHEGYQLEVHEVFRGVAATSDVVSDTGCGLERMDVGATYLVFANREDDVLMSWSCSGTGLADPTRIDAVEDVTGPGEPPPPDVGRIVDAILALFTWPS